MRAGRAQTKPRPDVCAQAYQHTEPPRRRNAASIAATEALAAPVRFASAH
jgi:hypothetical protein